MAQTLAEIKDSARPLLIRLALVSHAPAGSYGAKPRHRGTPEHRRPPGEAYPEAERLSDALSRAVSASAALAVVDEIRVELARATRRAVPPDATETAEDLAERIVEDCAGWSAADVALACRCLPSFVRASRLSLGRDPETGYTVPDGDPMEVAATLYGMGRSFRTISRLTGVPLATLHRRLVG
jgi:hypothetical protein